MDQPIRPEALTPEEPGLVESLRQWAYQRRLPVTLVKFLIVGGVGFVINQLFLFLLYDTPAAWFLPDKHADADLLVFTHPDIRLLIASIVAVEIAIVTQFNFHDRWTFRHRPRGGGIITRFFKFNASSIVSPIIVVGTVNILTPIIRDSVGDDTLIGTVAPYLANTVGVALGFIWNWTLNSLVIWPHQRERADTVEG